jgi:hypothetical protein
MPSSRFNVIPLVLSLVVKYKPESILDIGIGFGKYGVLFREYLDIWTVDKPYDKRITNIIGVEAFPQYENPVWQIYDQVIVEDIRKIADTLPAFDLVFMGDVIEHFSKEDGRTLLEELKYKHIIIVTPKDVLEQEAVYGNDFEIHKSKWTEEDFPGLKHILVKNQQIFFTL